MNKNEAEKHLANAKILMKNAEYDKAIYLLQKSIQLNESEIASKLLKKAKVLKKKSDPPRNTYSAEEEEFSKKILAKTNYYDILDLPNGASQTEVKKSYKKLVLRLHPDKTNCPSGSDAFKKVCKAYKCLTDEGKKEYYDINGEDYENNSNVEDFFRNFSMTMIFVHFLHDTVLSPAHFIYKEFEASSEKIIKTKIIYKVLPLFLIFFLLLSSGPVLYKDFSFQPSPYYSSLKSTQSMNLAYYVNPLFFNTLSEFEAKTLDSDIEQSYLSELNKQCEKVRNEKQHIQNLIKKTSGYDCKILEKYSESLDTSACKRLEELISVY